jgi:hypothetical protein
MGKKGKTIGGGMPGPGKYIISGGHGAGKYGQPHKFYGEGAAKYKGPHKQLEDLSGDGKITQKDVLIGRGVLEGDKGPKKMSGESYDMKQAYNKNLTEGARFNYLKNALRDKGGMSKYKSDDQRKAVHASKAEQGPGKMKKDKQKISKLQDDVLAGSAKYSCGKK